MNMFLFQRTHISVEFTSLLPFPLLPFLPFPLLPFLPFPLLPFPLHPLQDGSELPLKVVGTGESIHSMLSILDSVVESPKLFKSVAARAVRDTYVLQ